MLGLVTRHSLIAICLAVFLEELGIPMPIPTDILIVFAGVAAGQSLPRLLRHACRPNRRFVRQELE